MGGPPVSGGRFAELDAVTLDAYGTLVELDDPVGRLREALSGCGVERDEDTVRAAFEVEADHYVPRSHTAGDERALADLRLECARVFLETAEADVEPAAFVGRFVEALVFRAVPGARRAVDALAARGLALAVVSNWDVSLPQHLRAAGFGGRFGAIVSSAEAGAPKPDPSLWRLALERLGVEPARTIHVGDRDVDAEGAAAAGIRSAPAPLESALAGWA